MRAAWAKIGSGYGDWLWRAVYYSQGMIYGSLPFWADTLGTHPIFYPQGIRRDKALRYTLLAIIFASQKLQRLL